MKSRHCLRSHCSRRDYLPAILAPLFLATAARAEVLAPSDGALGDYFGQSVALSGTSAALGAYHVVKPGLAWTGQAYFFRDLGSTSGTAIESAILTPSNPSGGDLFGHDVGIVGNNVLVGSPYTRLSASHQGLGYYYRNLANATGTVTETLRLSAKNAAEDDNLGYFVALFGDNALLTAPGGAFVAYYTGLDSLSAEDARYDAASGTYTESLRLTSSDHVAKDNYGLAVDLDGTNALVGAFHAATTVGETTLPFTGRAYYYNLAAVPDGATSVAESVRLSTSEPAENASLGRSVSLEGDNALVCAYGMPSGDLTYVGAAYYYKNLSANTTGTATESLKLAASNGAGWDYFGNSLSLSGDNALVGAYFGTVNNLTNAGKAYYFANLDSASGTLNETLEIMPGTPREGALFGYAVALDGTRFVITSLHGTNSETGADSGTAFAGDIRALTTLDSGEILSIDNLGVNSKTDWIIGKSHYGNGVSLSAGSQFVVATPGKSVTVGAGEGADQNILRIDGILVAGTVNVGMGGKNTNNILIIGEGGVVYASTLNVGDAPVSATNTLVLDSGSFLILSGDDTAAIASLAESQKILLRHEVRFTAATGTLLASTYCTSAEEAQAFLDENNLADCPYPALLLSNCTLVASRIMNLSWARLRDADGNWFDSRWYGWFYNAADWGRWIWHPQHGWQYIRELPDGALCIWDSASGAWWYTNREWYPAMYDFSKGQWFYYGDGEAPNRRFWSYDANDWVSEGSR
jgi:hypothetical protein